MKDSTSAFELVHWHCLVADGQPLQRSREIARSWRNREPSASIFRAADDAERSSVEPIGVSLVETELPAGASEAVRRLALLDTVERRQLIVKAFVEGRRLPDIEKLVGPIRELDPCVPAPPDRRHRRTLPIALVGGAALAAIALLSSTGSTGTSDLATQGERLISTTSAPVVETTEPSVPLVVAPDRQVELIIEAGVVVRLDPSTRERLWSTSAFDDVSIIDVNGDIITIDSAGRRLYLSLRDGTLLPP